MEQQAVSVSDEVLIIGLGATGLSVAKHLARQGLAFAVADTRYQPPGLDAFKQLFPQASIWLGPLDANLLCQAARLVVSPGVSLAEPAIQEALAAGVEVTGDIDLFCQATRTPILAITGSNAKSTVTCLTGELASSLGLEVGVGGNLGLPVLDLLDEGTKDLYVLELSSFQLETTHKLAAQGAVILNISEDHLDRYPSYEDYVFAKQRIFHHAKQVIYNRQDELTQPIHGLLAQASSFGLDAPPGSSDLGLADVEGELWLMRGEQQLMPARQVPLAGEQGLQNVLAAFALLAAADLPVTGLAEVIGRFQGLPHRCQRVASKQGVDFFNDSKATNLGATLAAIKGLSANYQHLWLILGGESKGQDFAKLTEALRPAVSGVALLGRDASLLAASLPPGISHWFCDDMQEAVQCLAEQAQPGDALVLTPACASFDQFQSYAHRGEVFTQCVQQLPG